MDIRNILLIIIGLLSLVFAGYIYGRNRKSDINVSFAMLWFCAAIWSLGLAGFSITGNYSNASLFVKIYYIAAMFIAPSFLYFSIVFPYPAFEVSLKKIIYLFTPSSVMAILLLIPGFMIGKSIISENGNTVELKFGYCLYAVLFITYIVIAFRNLAKKYISGDGISRVQLKYTSLGLLAGFIIGTTFNLFFPLFGNYQIIWAGPLSAFVVMGFVFYLIMRK